VDFKKHGAMIKIIIYTLLVIFMLHNCTYMDVYKSYHVPFMTQYEIKN